MQKARAGSGVEDYFVPQQETMVGTIALIGISFLNCARFADFDFNHPRYDKWQLLEELFWGWQRESLWELPNMEFLLGDVVKSPDMAVVVKINGIPFLGLSAHTF